MCCYFINLFNFQLELVDGLCGWTKSITENHGNEFHRVKAIIVLSSVCSLLWEDEEIWGGWADVSLGSAEVSFYVF